MLQILFPSIITLKQEAYRRFYDVWVQLTISNIINKYFYINTLKRTAHAYFKMASILNILRKKSFPNPVILVPFFGIGSTLPTVKNLTGKL